LSSALKHPSSSFLLFNELKPLSKDPSKLAFTTFQDVQPLIGDNLFSKSEDELIEEYNSTVTIPQMIFLGLDERNQDGLTYKEIYKGAPVWAIDVTPKGSTEEAANKVIKEMESRNLTFIEARMILSLSAHDGKSKQPYMHLHPASASI